MRRPLAITILALYAVLSIGVQLHLHYCCGKLAEIALWSSGKCEHTHDHPDACCMHESCCSFQDLSFKIDDLHQGTSFRLTENLPEMIAVLPALPLIILTKDESCTVRQTSNGPPLYKAPIWLQHQQIVVYA